MTAKQVSRAAARLEERVKGNVRNNTLPVTLRLIENEKHDPDTPGPYPEVHFVDTRTQER